MKRTLALLCFAFVSVCTALRSDAAGAQKGKVLIVAREGATSDLGMMLDKEVGTMKILLEQEGYSVWVASGTGRPIVAETKTLKPDLKLSAVNVADYAGFIIPCLTMGPEVPDAYLPLIREVVAKGKPVAAVNGGVQLLAQAGALTGKKYSLITELYGLKGAVYGGTGVVQDGKIITSAVCPMIAKVRGLPDGTSALTKALIALMRKK